MGEQKTDCVLSIITLFILVSYPFVGSIGASSEMWSKTYGGVGDEVAHSLVYTSDGGYALAGYTVSFGAGWEDFWLVKTDEFGNMEWNQTYGGIDADLAFSLVETSDGGYAIAGKTYSFGAEGSDFWLVKTDEFGNIEWSERYGGPGEDSGHSLVETSDGGFAIAGLTYSYGAGASDFWLVKTDRYGNCEWNRTYGGEQYDGAQWLIVASDGGFMMAGYKDQKDNYVGANFWLIKTDAYGNMLWNRTYDNWVDSANSVVETSDGGYALAGSAGFWYPHACWFVKTDENGFMTWNTTYGDLYDQHYETAHSVVETWDGGFALACRADYFGDGNYDFWVIKTDEYGTVEWNQTFGGTGSEEAYSLVETSDGGYGLAGYTSSFGAGDNDFWLVKTNQTGVIPEFPSWAILLLLLIATLVLMLWKKTEQELQRVLNG